MSPAWLCPLFSVKCRGRFTACTADCWNHNVIVTTYITALSYKHTPDTEASIGLTFHCKGDQVYFTYTGSLITLELRTLSGSHEP